MDKTFATCEPDQPIYLRIGAWHHTETSRNYAAGDTEAGVSVYDLTPDGSIVIPEEHWSHKDLHMRLSSEQPRYLVQGDWVGCGAEGEPLLQNLRTIGIWPVDLKLPIKSSITVIEDETLLTVQDFLESYDAREPSPGP